MEHRTFFICRISVKARQVVICTGNATLILTSASSFCVVFLLAGEELTFNGLVISMERKHLIPDLLEIILVRSIPVKLIELN